MNDEENAPSKDQIMTLLQEILKWVKATSFRGVSELLSESLQSDEEILAYHFSDGRSSREVASLSRASQSTITEWWKKWARLGLIELIDVQRGQRAKRIFSLGDHGIEVPKVKETATAGGVPEKRTDEQSGQGNP